MRQRNGLRGRLANAWRTLTGTGELPDAAWSRVFYGSSGQIAATERQALAIAALHRCVQILAGTISTLPVHVYTSGDRDERKQAPRHPLNRLLRINPNRRLTPSVFWATVVEHAALWGNAYIEVLRDDAYRPVELWIHEPRTVGVELLPDGTPQYIVRGATGERVLPDDRVMHIVGPWYNGLRGLSVVEQFPALFATGAGLDTFLAQYWRCGAKPAGVLKSSGPLSAEAVERLRENWSALYDSALNSGRTVVLEEGLEFEPLVTDISKSDPAGHRQQLVLEVARIFGIPPNMVGVMERSSYASIEAQNTAFLQHTIRPWLVRLEQGVDRTLLRPSERGRYYVRWTVEGLLRADLQARVALYSSARQNGWMTVNEIRRLEDMPAVPGGDVLLQPLNMAPVSEGLQAENQMEVDDGA